MIKEQKKVKKDIGIYIHIPFCKHKCYYCDFVSFADREEKVDSYIKSLIKEIEHTNLNNYNIQTVYIGGGTPSVIDSRYIGMILEKINLNPSQNREITIEINPGTVNKEKLEYYKKIGINRLSIRTSKYE